MTPSDKSSRVKALAAQVGFDLAGITPAAAIPRAEYYRDWLAKGHAGSMAYLGRNGETRQNPSGLLPGAKSIVCVALNYRRPASEQPDQGNGATGRVAQYARGSDYHAVMRDMLEELVARLRDDLAEPFEARLFVDTGPLIERELAAAAGLGWIGKNTLVLNRDLGSFFFLGEIITTLDLAPDLPVMDHCGTCTRCLDACPTQAFTAPYQMDAGRCISYFTIEHRGEIPADFHAAMGDWIYGCDICQDVCPYNARGPLGTNPLLTQERIPARVELSTLIDLSAEDYRRLTRGTAANRAKLHMWRRNAQIAHENSNSHANS